MLTLLLAGIAAKLALGVVGAARGMPAARFIYGLTAALSAVLGVLAIAALATGGGWHRLSLPLGLPGLSANFRLDALSAWFLLTASLGGAAAAIYAIGYATHLAEPQRALPFFPIFLAAIDLVLIADDAFVFLFAWEAMAVASWLLVLVNHREAGNAVAARLYLVMAMAGTACLLLAFGLLAGAEGAYHFDAWRGQKRDAAQAGFVVVLALIGAGSKAGLFPLHAWLPLAHPAAPSHVSALMSGVMTKVAIYGLMRILFEFVGPLEWGWGAIVMTIGAITAVMGILYALMERDLKTLLAYSTIENIGLVTVALGLALVFRANAMPGLTALALAACLLHVFNHAVMKSLLFFVAGAVHVATGTRDLEQLGGLIQRMPRTATLALIGAASIAALPPLNGFVSEWLVFQAILSAPSLPQWALKFEIPVVGASLALTAAFAAACFVRAFGTAFLGRPRTPAARDAHEVGAAMGIAMALLAALCVGSGAVPGAILGLMGGAVEQLAGTHFAREGLQVMWISPFGLERAAYGGLMVLLVVTILTWIIIEIVHRNANPRRRRGPAWDCGFPDPTPAAQYTASSFAQPLRRVFGTLVLHARERVDMPEPGETRAARFAVNLRDPAWAGLYAPTEKALGWLADRFNRFQYLTIRRYLSLVFAVLVVMLCVVVVRQ